MSLAFCQTMYKGQLFRPDEPSTEFQYLMKNGLTYIKTGYEELDDIMINSLEERWTCTPIKIEEADAWDRISDTTALFIYSIGRIFVLPSSALKGEKRTFSIQSSFVCMRFGGFCKGVQSYYFFLDHMVAAVNAVVDFEMNRFKDKTVKEIEEMIWYSAACTSELRKHLIPSTAKIIKEKTMLFVADNDDYVNPKIMEEYGLKYKKISLEAFQNLSEAELVDYTIFYFSSSPDEPAWSLLIMDLENYSPLFLNSGLNSKSKFSKSDIELMEAYW